MALEKFKQFLSSKPLVITILILGPVVLMATWLSSSRKAQASTTKTYYYDTRSNDLFTSPTFRLPPISAPSDDADSQARSGVIARVFSCSSCEVKDSRIVGYLETYSPDALKSIGLADVDLSKADHESLAMNIAESAAAHIFVRSPDNDQWHVYGSKQGQAIVTAARRQCPDSRSIKECLP